MSSMTSFATFALATPMNDSAPVWSVITPTLILRVEVDASMCVPLSGVVGAAEPGGLGAALVPGFLQDRGDVRVGDEALPAFGIPVEEHPDAVGLVGIAEDGCALGTVLPSLLGAGGREDVQEAVEVLDLRRCQDHALPPLRFSAPR